MKQNKISGFWIRLFSRFLDLTFFSIFSLLLAYIFLVKKSNVLEFDKPYFFYIWNIFSILLLFTISILFPIAYKGQTPGMLLLGIQIIFENENRKLRSQIKRELFFSLAWIFNLIALLTIINHPLINKILINRQNAEYSIFENMRIALFATSSSMIFLMQWIFAFSIMIRKGKIGFHDQMSKTKTVYKNKFEKIERLKPIVCFKPFMIKNKKIKWVQNV